MSTGGSASGNKRVGLEPYLGTKQVYEGTVGASGSFTDYFYGKTMIHANEIEKVCIEDLEHVAAGYIFDHVWVTYTETMKRKGLEMGDRIRFTAWAYEYSHNNASQTKEYGLNRPGAIKVLSKNGEDE